jgi:hypothetical protein
LSRRRIRGDFSGSGNGNTDAKIPIKMISAAARAITLAGVLIPKAGKFVAAANAVAISGLGRGLDSNQCHGFSLRLREKDGMEKKNTQAGSSRNFRKGTSGSLPATTVGQAPYCANE